MTSTVYVEVSGLTGSGKSAVMGEIGIALKALGLKIEYGPDFQAEKNGTHADWQTALDLYQPTVVLTERNISRQPPAREDAQPVADAVEPIECAVAALKGHIEAIQLAKAGGGSSSVITDCVNELPEIVRWIESGVFNVEAVFEQREDTSPAPDALRVAVEALEPFAAHPDFHAGDDWPVTFVNDEERVPGVTAGDFRRARQALAALQAEQKGGA